MAGPTCGLMLADMGADVIKVEKLPGGDDARGYREPRVNGVSAPFMMLNRNKRGIAVDLKRPQGREILLRLVKDTDVLTENYRRGTLEKLGLGYDVLAKVNPGLIYCAISGYGRDGPLGDRGGFDLIAQGFAGLMSITGEADGPPRRTAIRSPTSTPASSRCPASRRPTCTSSRRAAARSSTRRSWKPRCSRPTGMRPSSSRPARRRVRADPRTSLTAPYQAFRASDGWINIGGANQANWERIADVLGHPGMARRRALRDEHGTPREPSRARLADERRARAREPRPNGSNGSMPPACRWGRSIRSARRSRIRRRSPAAWSSISSIRKPAPTKALGCPIHFSGTPTAITRPAPALGRAHARSVARARLRGRRHRRVRRGGRHRGRERFSGKPIPRAVGYRDVNGCKRQTGRSVRGLRGKVRMHRRLNPNQPTNSINEWPGHYETCDARCCRVG